ncbi:putative RNA methyltransferase [Aestuariirhabdus litorea]|uniref:Methyltransferase domain-containing protein n=1 Tax=Aestuariirhabdus litorea TaxID=2528527 RepID=A0A3P3VQY0_9GAMM|nr:methyltransferase domain-containing protein [Aestuariirhabdus litorea]RRJ85135.1 methyltransferase domain-containing protein [Aestuariirhabdus litorea]RWW98358.1 methyltransferase domain-containing protein [Endozoicomonadaceae bacterium GTF-13]
MPGLSHWCCPHCRCPLQAEGNSWRCANNHSFDRARQGYVNLLPSNRKQSKQPGDSPEMVNARSRFLDTGHYHPLREAVLSLLQGRFDDTAGSWLDAGCGEGWYTAALASALPAMQGFAFDISKCAVSACCRRSKAIEWAVASVADIPLADASMRFILSIFSRIDWVQFERILVNEGLLLAVTPGSHHLLELRQAIYREVRLHEEEKPLKEMPTTFECIATESCQFNVHLENQQQIQDLLAMTPHYWHIKADQRERLAQLPNLTTRADFRLTLFQKKSAQAPALNPWAKP